MNYFVSYDISADRLRSKVSKALERHGALRVQKSVFFLPGFSGKEMMHLKNTLETLLHKYQAEPNDSILCIPVEKDQLDGIIWVGENVGFQQALQKKRVIVV